MNTFSNFDFLKKIYPSIAEQCTMVEKLANEDSASFITQLDEAVDAILNEIYIYFIHKDANAEPEGSVIDRIMVSPCVAFEAKNIISLLSESSKSQGEPSHKRNDYLLRLLFDLCVWLVKETHKLEDTPDFFQPLDQKPFAYEGEMPYIFVSYAHKDSSKVLPIIKQLQDKNYRIWYDSGIEVGSEWPEYIASHLSSSKCVLVFMSKNSSDSINCRQEITFAINKSKKLIVIYLEDFNLPSGLEMQLCTIQSLFYYQITDSNEFINKLKQISEVNDCIQEELAESKNYTISNEQTRSKVISYLNYAHNIGVSNKRLAKSFIFQNLHNELKDELLKDRSPIYDEFVSKADDYEGIISILKNALDQEANA